MMPAMFGAVGVADAWPEADPVPSPDEISHLKVAYLHGRPGPHPAQGQLAEAVGAEFSYVDFRLRWQDRQRPRLYVIASWLLCAATAPGRSEYNVFLVDNLHIGPVLMKRLFLRSDQKILVHLGSHTLYFLLTHRFGRWVERMHVWALRRYDALICEGRMAVDMAELILGNDRPPIYETYTGIDDSRADAFSPAQPDLESKTLIFVGSGPGEFRMHYKGLDVMIDAVAHAVVSDPQLELKIVGAWDSAVIEGLLGRLESAVRDRVHFVGPIAGTSALAETFSRSALYLHCSRGDAFPGATIEAMMAGLVPLVSEWTGTKHLVSEVSEQLVVPLDAAKIAEKISWYFGLDLPERQRLSDLSRAVAFPYRSTLAAENYQMVFGQICRDLNVVAKGART